MPLIKTYETNEAKGELLEIYNEIIKVRGEVGNNAKLFSSSPELLKQQLDFIKYYSTHPTLSMALLASCWDAKNLAGARIHTWPPDA